MDAVELGDMIANCSPSVHPRTMTAIVRAESGGNPYAIGVVGGRLQRQPQHLAEAVATASALERGGWNFSLGLAQVNRHNLAQQGLDYASAFNACANLRAGAAILQRCYSQALARYAAEQPALQAALSCYYSGGFERGFVADEGGTSYVQRVLRHAGPPALQQPAANAARGTP